MADETELKANANKRIREVVVEQVEEKEKDLAQINEHRTHHGKKPLLPKEGTVNSKRTNIRPVGPDARLSVKHDERGRFAYFEQRVVNSLHQFSIETDVTSANVPGHRILVNQLDTLKELFGQYAKELALDSGYYQAHLARELFERGFFVYVSYRQFSAKEHPN